MASKDPHPPAETAPPAVTLTAADIAAIVQAAVSGAIAAAPRALSIDDVKAEMARVMAKPADEVMRADIDRLRGRDRPLPKEFLIPCRSPMTGATFAARCVASRSFPEGSVVELLDYVYPPGIDQARSEGGLYPYPADTMYADPAFGNPPGAKSAKYKVWLWDSFRRTDMRALLPGGEFDRVSVSGLANWRTDIERVSVEQGAVVITAAQLAALGLTAEQIRLATGQAEPPAPADKAAE
jgi:hypothetical protein